mmetsp:Transcript_620/g.1593  ORF Transcript_620/g.1593 Transcript_620/m.1593 type:complete len:509 (-) Transcript_620:324-1850(-)
MSATFRRSGGGKSPSLQQQPSADLYGKLNAYERARKTNYAMKLDSLSLKWKAYRDLLSASLRETSRAQRVVLGTSHAMGVYSEALQAIFDDAFLDEKGMVASEKQRKALRSEKDKKKQFDPTRPSSSKNKSVSVLKEIKESQRTLADRFQETSTNMDEEIAEAIGSLLETVQESFVTIEKLGTSILSELERTEQEVTQSWGKYLNAKSPSSAPGARGTTGGGRNDGGKGTNKADEDSIDPWVVEMQYRVAVAYQNQAWQKGNDELTELFTKVQHEEIDRRMNLREFLVAFAQRQQRLFLGLPEIQNQVLEELVGKEMSRDDMEKAVHEIIEKRASMYKKDATTGADLDADDFSDFNLESPLSSDLLSKAKVVLRTGPGLDWTLSLAVMTADSYLHMFDIEGSSVKLNTAPEVAFAALVPKLIEPNADNQLLGKTNFARGWSDTLTPSESVVLGRCKVKHLDENIFELSETLGAVGTASKLIGKKAKKKVQIQTPTKEEADDWIQILTA